MRTFATAGAPHWRANASVQRMMGDVLIALVPGIAAHVWYFGTGLLLQILLACVFALAAEAAMLRVRDQPLRPFLTDLSAIVTAVLFALCLPPLAPWWVSLVGMLAAIVLAKQLFGGLGHNLFNPAMVGYAVVLVSFPRELSQWLSPLTTQSLDFGQVLDAVFRGVLPRAWDTLASATPLDTLHTLVARGLTVPEIHRNPLFGDFGGAGWEWIAIAYVVGGTYLLWRGVIRWQVPAGVLGSVVLLSLPFWLSDPDVHPSPLAHVFSGALVLGAFFIATDPVTGATSPRGRLVFGVGVGAITLAIRCWGEYPDGVAFAVLLMNALVPLIDRVTVPRVVGREPRP